MNSDTLKLGESIFPALLVVMVYIVLNPGSTPLAILLTRTSAAPPCTTLKAFGRVALLPSGFRTVKSQTPGVVLVRLKVAVSSCPSMPTITGEATAPPQVPLSVTLAPLWKPVPKTSTVTLPAFPPAEGSSPEIETPPGAPIGNLVTNASPSPRYVTWNAKGVVGKSIADV